jgi:hypothetical protein
MNNNLWVAGDFSPLGDGSTTGLAEIFRVSNTLCTSPTTNSTSSTTNFVSFPVYSYVWVATTSPNTCCDMLPNCIEDSTSGYFTLF